MKIKFKLISYCFVMMIITSCGKSEPPSAEIMNLKVGVMRKGQPVLSEKVTLYEFTNYGIKNSSKWINVNENTWNYKYEFTDAVFKKNVSCIDTYTKIEGAVIFSGKVCDGESINIDQRIGSLISFSLNDYKITE